MERASFAPSTRLAPGFDVAAFIHEYYDAWGGTDLDRIMSYYAEDVVLEIPGLLMEGKEAVRDQFAVPFTTAFPGNRHIVKSMVFGPGVVVVEFSFEAQQKGPFAGYAATGARINLPGCGVYQYDAAKLQITAGRIYFDVGTLLQTIRDCLLGDRKKAEEALRTNERNLSLITNVIPTFIHILRADGSVLYANQAVLGYTGLTLEDVRRENYCVRVFHPEDVETLREECRDALTRPVPFENEQRVLGKDGKYRWFLIRYNPLLDARGKIDRWYVAAFDIDDRKQTEWLRAAEMRTLQMIADGASLTDILNNVCTSIDAQISPRFTTILLMDPDGKRLWPTAGPKVPADWVRAITPLPVAAETGLCGTAAFLRARVIVPDVATESVWQEEYRSLALKNAIRAGWSQPILAKENEVLGTFAVYSAEPRLPTTEDLALMEAAARLALIAIERQRSQEALRSALEEIQRSESKLRQVIDAIPALAWRVLPDGSNEFLNKGWHEYTGLSPEQSHGWGWQAAFHPDDLPPLMENWVKMVASGKSGEVEARLRRHDGVYRWFLIRAQAFRDESGKIVRWYGTGTDIDDRKRVEDAQACQARVRADVSAAFSKPIQLREILRGCTEAIVRQIDAAFARIWMLNKDENTLELQASAGMYTRLNGSYSRIPVGDLKVGWIARERKPHFTNDVTNDPRLHDKGWAQDNGMVAFAGYPLVVEDRLIGVVALFARRPFSESILDTLASVADTIAQGIERKQAEEALRRSEFYLGEGQRLSHAGSWSFKPDGTCDYWSRELYEILGFDPKKGIPTISDYLTRVHPEDRQIVEATIQRMIATGEGCDLKKRIVLRSNGVQRVIRCVGMPVRENGLVTRFVGTLMDITEQEELTQELRRREAYLAEAQRLSHTGSFGWNYGATGELTWSEETYRICGFDRSIKPTFQLVRERVHPDDLHVWQQAFDRVMEGKEVDFENRLVMPDGTVKFLHSVASGVQKDGKFVELVGTVRDVTEWKCVEEAMRRSEAFLAEGQRLSHTGSWGWNASTGKLTWSQEHFRVLGLDPQTTNPSLDLFWERVHPDDRIDLRRTFECAIRDKRDFEQEFRIVTPDWSIRHLHGVGHAILNRANELVEFIGSTMDVTERKRAEERAQSQRETIRLALNAFVEELDVNRFLGDVMAELNKQFHAKSWELWLFDEGVGALLFQSSSHQGESFSRGIGNKNAWPPAELQGFWQRKDDARAPQILQLPAQESLLSRRQCESLKALGIKTLMIVPLVLGEQNLGFLELHFPSLAQFTPDDLELAQALVNHATLALQLNRLTRRAEQLAVTEERNRLARDIHDTLAQAFAGIVLHSEALGASLPVSKQRSLNSLSQIKKLARSGLDEARRSVQALRPKALEGSTISEALKHEAKRLTESGKISCQFRLRGESQRLSLEAQNELFRIAQEALTNVSKHAQATSVWINLTFAARQVALTIRDNGVGLAATTTTEPKRGYGLGTMRERAQRIGGQLEVQSPKSGGTSIRVRVPLAETDKGITSHVHQ